MDKIKSFLSTLYLYLLLSLLIILVIATLWVVLSPSTFMKVIPLYSWWYGYQL